MLSDRVRRFFDLAVASGVLRFGEFVLKSGRMSPYFFNAGLFHSGTNLGALGRLYAETIVDADLEFDLVFGPAYKGIPLAATTVIGLSSLGRDVPYAFNRKEAKDHGEGGTIVGHPLPGRKVLIVDDVISSGTSIGEAVNMIRKAGGEATGVVIALDRQERGIEGVSALAEVRSRLSLTVTSIATVSDLVSYLRERGTPDAQTDLIEAYLSRYGSGMS